MNIGLDQYMDIFKDAVEDSAAKLTKSFEKILIEVIILFMVIPRKINFTQMGRYGSHVEQTYRNAFGLKKSKSIDWLKLNVLLAKRFFGKQGRWAIAIDPSYISKAGKKTPHIGRFWSGCAQSVKHGLEIMGIGLIDIDAKDCMMLKAHQSLSNKELRQGNAIFSQQLTFRGDCQLRTLDLLLYLQVHQTRDRLDSGLDQVTDRKHQVQVRTKQFDSDIRLRAGKHSVDTMGNRLPDLYISAADRR